MRKENVEKWPKRNPLLFINAPSAATASLRGLGAALSAVHGIPWKSA